MWAERIDCGLIEKAKPPVELRHDMYPVLLHKDAGGLAVISLHTESRSHNGNQPRERLTI
jgi:hypothetical protein